MPRRPIHSIKWPLTPTQVEAINEMFEQLFREFRRGLPELTEFDGILEVEHGGSGRSSATPYAVICGGTTNTGPHQSVPTLGSSGQMLTSQGAGTLPTWTTPVTALDDLSDVTLTSPSDGHILVYDGADWVNEDPSATVQAAGYWTPLTDGDEDETFLIYADAEPVMVFIAT